MTRTAQPRDEGINDEQGRTIMSWDTLFPVALAIGFLVLWLFVLPRMGIRT